MLIWIIIVVCLGLAYGLLMLFYIYGWFMVPSFNVTEIKEELPFFSIIIPARNEEKNIKTILNDLSKLEYPALKWEAIVVDDFSEDQTATIVSKFSHPNISLLSLDKEVGTEKLNSYKKQAIALAITKSNGNWIITTDADCRLNKHWLQTIASFIENEKPKMIAAPVMFENEQTGFEKMQSLDFSGLIGITASSMQLGFPTMCNGANLAFEKKVFYEVGGYTGVEKIASGDDLFLMHKVFKKYPKAVRFLKSTESLVTTFAIPDIKTFFHQRTRWTSKSTHYTDKRITAILMMAYFFNLTLLVNVLFMFQNYWMMELFVFQFAFKLITEFVLINEVTTFFNKKKLMWWFLPAQLFHVFYVIIIGISGLTATYKWKNRTVK